MPLRRLLNVAYAALSEGRETDDLKELDEQLETPPGEKPKPRTRGNLAAVMSTLKTQKAPS